LRRAENKERRGSGALRTKKEEGPGRAENKERRGSGAGGAHPSRLTRTCGWPSLIRAAAWRGVSD